MRRSARVDALLARLPEDDAEGAVLRARATAYGKECGCTMGAAFLAGAMLLALLYFTVVGGLSVWRGIAGFGFVFLAALCGKAAGLALASLRLALLRRSILSRLRAKERLDHVHVH